jgi:hypothetical protein
MKLRSSMVKAVAGAALFAFAVAPPAFAKKIKDSGTNSVTCLTSDEALCTALGGTFDPNTKTCSADPIEVSVAPSSLWPPNHKMRTESLSVGLTQPFVDTGSYPNGADILVWISNITDNQFDVDALGGHGCGSKNQSPDWSPAVDSTVLGSFLTGSTSAPLTNAAPSAALNIVDENGASAEVDLRGERCARDGTRNYFISVMCCDLDAGVCDDQSYVGISPTSTPSAAPTPTQDLNVQVLKSRKHHGKP